MKSCKALQRCQVFLKCHVSARTWTSVSEQRHFSLEQKAAALYADSWSTLSALLGIRHWRRGMHVPLVWPALGLASQATALLPRSAVTLVAPFCHSSLILHSPLSIVFLLWAGIRSWYRFEQQKGNQTLFCGVQNNRCRTLKSQK